MYRVWLSPPKGKRKSAGIRFVEATEFSTYENAEAVARRWKLQNPDYVVFIITKVL